MDALHTDIPVIVGTVILNKGHEGRTPWALLDLDIPELYRQGANLLVQILPVLLPLLEHAKVDLVHFGIFFVLNCMIGAVTPPVGTMMYVVCALSKTSIVEFAREVWPFVIALVIALLIVTYVPILSLWLPNLIIPG